MSDLLARPDYVVNDAEGRMVGMHCKVCGVPIAGIRMADNQFVRFNNYGEMKMKFATGDFHVTNLCHSCLETVPYDRDLMYAVFCADVDNMAKEVPSLAKLKLQGKPTRCVAVDTKRLGIT